MHSLLWLGFRAFIISLVLTPICRDVFRSYGVVDQPDAARKVHRYPIPRVGGLAIAIPHGPGVPYYYNSNLAPTVGARFTF